MKAIDWNVKSDQYRLANAVLSDDWNESATIMKRIGKEGSVGKLEYQNWPLFNELRKQELFLKTYQDIFGHKFDRDLEIKENDSSISKN